jgi:hypothetical protein
MAIEKLHIMLNPPFFYNTEYDEDMSRWDRLEAGLKVAISGPVDDSNFRWFQMPSNAGNDMQMIRSHLRDDGIQISGVNPMAYSFPKAGEPVRNNMITMESTLKMLKKIFKNWGEGDKDSTRQLIALMKQYYPVTYTQEVDEYNKDRQYKTIQIDGYSIVQDPNTKELIKEPINGKSSIEIKPEYLSLTADVGIELDVDSLIPVSKGLQMQKAQEALGALVPLLMNPQALAAPGVLELISFWIDSSGIPSAVKDRLQDNSSEDDNIIAEIQNQQMMNGEFVTSVPGESDSHKMIHVMKVLDLETKKRNLDPLSQSPEETSKIDEQLAKLIEHVTGDNQPKFGIESTLKPPQPPIDMMRMGGQQPGPMPSEDQMMQMMTGSGGMSPEMMQGVMPQEIGAGVGVQLPPQM